MANTPQNLLSYVRLIVGAWRDDPRDDTQLLARFVENRDESAFTALLWRHGPLVWRTCTRVLGDGPDAEDVFQATFLTLASRAGKLRGDTLVGWLLRVAQRVALNVNAGTRRRRSLEQRLRSVAQSIATVETDRAELYAALNEELAGLPEKLRVPLLLRYLEGKSQDEVAEILGCSRFVVRTRLAQGEAILRKRLERRGIEVGVLSVGALLGDTAGASEMPACLIGRTTRAAMAFRSGAFTGGHAEAARTVVEALPSSLGTTIMRKSLWIMLACVGFLGVGLAAWQAPAGHSDGVGVTAPESPRGTAEPNSGRVDCFGDPLPPGALARLGTLRLRHIGKRFISDGGANSVVFSRDGKVLITAGWDNPIRLWDAATGKLLRSFGDRRKNPALSIVLSPDGRTLATGNQTSSVCLWEVATGKLLRQLNIGTSVMAFSNALAFSQDGRTLLSAGQDNHLHVWEIATAKEVRDQTLENAEKADKDLGRSNKLSVFSPDGKIMASIYNKTNDYTIVVYFWETATGKELHHLTLGEEGKTPQPGAVAFSPDSRYLALAVPPDVNPIPDISDRAVRLLEVATGKEVRRWTLDDKAGTYSLAFSPDGKVLATGSGLGPIRFWETATGKQLRRCQSYRAHVVALAFSPDGSTLASLAGIHDYTAQLWEVASGKERVPLSRGHVGPVLSVAFSPDGKDLISGGRDGLVALWNAETGQEQRPPLRVGDFQALAALSADSKTFVTVGNSFSPKGQNQKQVILQTPTKICFWDRATGQKLRQFQGPAEGFPQFLVLSPDGKILVLSFLKSTYLIEAATGKVMHSYDGDGFGLYWADGFLQYAALSPDGKTLAVLSRYEDKRRTTVHFYETATGKEVCSKEVSSITHQTPRIGCLAFSSDGQTLAIGGWESAKDSYHDSIQLWQVQPGKHWKEAGRFLGHQGAILGLTFSPDGKTLASAGQDGTVRLWEIATGQQRGCIGCFVGIDVSKKLLDCHIRGGAVFAYDNSTAGIAQVVTRLSQYSPKLVVLQATGGLEIPLVQALQKAQIPAAVISPREARDIAKAASYLAKTDRDNIGARVLAQFAEIEFAERRNSVWCLAFAPDGRRLAAGGYDTTILVWDVTDRLHNGQLRPAKLSAQEVKSLWADLAGADAARAGRAVWALVAAPAQVLPLLREHLRPVAPVDSKRIARLIADLDSDDFAGRQKAAEELAKLREVAEPALLQAFAKPASLEMRRRLEQLLEPLEKKFLAGEKLRSVRALEVLGQIGTPEALRLLEALAQGEPGARLTREAQAVQKWLRVREGNATKP